jgi:hypothetical protein
MKHACEDYHEDRLSRVQEDGRRTEGRTEDRRTDRGQEDGRRTEGRTQTVRMTEGQTKKKDRHVLHHNHHSSAIMTTNQAQSHGHYQSIQTRRLAMPAIMTRRFGFKTYQQFVSFALQLHTFDLRFNATQGLFGC